MTSVLTVQTGDDVLLEVSQRVASKSVTIMNLFGDRITTVSDVIPLPNVTSGTARVVFEFVRLYLDNPTRSSNAFGMPEWEMNFYNRLGDGPQRFKDLAVLLAAADYLDIQPLMTSVAKRFASHTADNSDVKIAALLGEKPFFSDEKLKELKEMFN